jgi:hypothetical protein
MAMRIGMRVIPMHVIRLLVAVLPLGCVAEGQQGIHGKENFTTPAMWQFHLTVTAAAWATLNADPITNQAKISLNLSVYQGMQEIVSTTPAGR